MKMKLKTYIKVFAATAGIMLATACQDWLTVYPQNQVVEENFWEDKSDLEGVRYAIYKQMCGTIEKMALWGDLRSNSYVVNSNYSNKETVSLYKEIREGRMERDSTNAYFDWAPFYTTINYCNKVLQHGSEVLAKDKQFTSSEWLHMRAEVISLRALNYFYLLRAFKDVPYTTRVVNSDADCYRELEPGEWDPYKATDQLVLLDMIIMDVEGVQGQAYNRTTDLRDTKGTFTNCAIYALLSDMYLWRASLHQGRQMDKDTVYFNSQEPPSPWLRAQQSTPSNSSKGQYFVPHTVTNDYEWAIHYADKSLASLAEQTKRNNASFGTSVAKTCNYGLLNCNLIKNDFEDFSNGVLPTLRAYEEIFCIGNSDESIFELQFSQSDQRTNGMGNSLWGYSGAAGRNSRLCISENALAEVYGKSQETERTRDSRLWFSAWKKLPTEINDLNNPACFKWSNALIGRSDKVSTYECKELSTLPLTSEYSNWIIYRMSDVMLQKAEAYAALYTYSGSDQSINKAAAKDTAWLYVNAIHRRWYCNDGSGSTAQPQEEVTNESGKKPRNTNNAETLGNAPGNDNEPEIAVLNERQIEFLAEGKRWFDAVRYAERHAEGDPSGQVGMQKMVADLMKNEEYTEKTLTNHLKNRWGLYNLIYYKEIQCSNGKLQQNEAWNKSKYDK